MLYLTLLTPILALPAVLLMDRVERWATDGRPGPARVAPVAPVAPMPDVSSGGREPLPQRGRPRPASRSRLLADPAPDLHRPKVALRS